MKSAIAADIAIITAGCAIPAFPASIINLGSLAGDNTSAYGINASGQVVGISGVDALSHVFLYTGGVMYDKGRGVAYAINNFGNIVGTGPDFPHGFESSGGPTGGTVNYMGVLNDPTTNGGTPYAINDKGEVAGAITTGDINTRLSYRGFVYTGGALQSLEPFGGGQDLLAFGINDNTEVVGAVTILDAATNESDPQAFYAYNGSVTPLGTLGGKSSSASAINNSDRL